jgi:hypothetical protein
MYRLGPSEGFRLVNIEDIVGSIRQNRIRITDHADEATQADHLSLDEILISVLRGDVIEDYPDDKPYPSCLIYGNTSDRSRCTAFGLIIREPGGRY